MADCFANPPYELIRGTAVRQLLFLPAVAAKACNPHVKAIYERLLAKGKPKMVAVGAAMRKLVHLCFGVVHSGKPYDPNWLAPA